MRDLVENIYSSSKVIITLGYGYEFRKNPRRRGKILFHEENRRPLNRTILDDEFKELFNKLTGNREIHFCYSYCNDFEKCSKERCYYGGKE